MVDLKKILKHDLIPFCNIINECCGVFDEDYVGEWLFTPNSNLRDEMPIEYMATHKGRVELLRLLRFIEIDEADLF